MDRLENSAAVKVENLQETSALATKPSVQQTDVSGSEQKNAEMENAEMEKLREKYKKTDGKIYEIETTIQEDDENETTLDFIFRKPGTPSYDRYVKTSGTSGSKALKVFVTDNICEEQREELKAYMEEYPALAISLGEKLLNMLGLSKDTTVKKL